MSSHPTSHRSSVGQPAHSRPRASCSLALSCDGAKRRACIQRTAGPSPYTRHILSSSAEPLQNGVSWAPVIFAGPRGLVDKVVMKDLAGIFLPQMTPSIGAQKKLWMSRKFQSGFGMLLDPSGWAVSLWFYAKCLHLSPVIATVNVKLMLKDLQTAVILISCFLKSTVAIVIKERDNTCHFKLLASGYWSWPTTLAPSHPWL